MTSKAKILLVYEDEEGCQVESVWASKSDEYYKIDNIPFFAKNIALGDLVSVENDDGELYFDSLIEASGHSTIQIAFFDMSKVGDVQRTLEEMGCHWEGSHIESLISVDVPIEVPYASVKEFLETQESLRVLEYREACLGQQ